MRKCYLAWMEGSCQRTGEQLTQEKPSWGGVLTAGGGQGPSQEKESQGWWREPFGAIPGRRTQPSSLQGASHVLHLPIPTYSQSLYHVWILLLFTKPSAVHEALGGKARADLTHKDIEAGR